MAKKKKSQKKHQFKYAQPSVSSSSVATSAPAALSAKPTSTKQADSTAVVANYDIANLGLIKADIRKVLLLAGSFIVFQLGLWLLVEHTSLGSLIYRLIKV